MQELESAAETAQQQPNVLDRTAAERFFARRFSLDVVLLAALFFVSVLISHPLHNPSSLLQDPDIWWHMANARHLFHSGFIRIEPYSFSLAGKPWTDSEWLSEIPFWLGFSFFGLRGLQLVTILACELNLFAIYLLCRQRGASARIAFLASVLGFLLANVNFGPRTILFGYLCLAIELAILHAWQSGRHRLLWLLPPLFVLWANLHGSWAIGAFVFLLFAIFSHTSISLGDFYSERLPLSQLRQIWAVTALSIAAVFINPYGWKLVQFPFNMAFHQQLNIANAQDWIPLHLSWPVGKIVILVALLLLLANGWRRRRWHLFEASIVLFGFYAAVAHTRFCFLLAVLAMPSLAVDLTRVWPSGSTPKPTRPLLNLAFALALCIAAISLIPSSTSLRKAYNRTFPTRLIAQIQPHWRLWDAEQIGGFLAFHHKPEFIDTRLGTFDHYGVFAQYLDAIRAHNTFAILDKYRIDHVLFQKSSSLSYLLRQSRQWKEIGNQDGYILFARTNN